MSRKPSVVLGWPARTAASLAGMSERTVQAWRKGGFYVPGLRLPKDLPLGWAPFVEMRALYGVHDVLALRAAHDIREAGASRKVAQVIAREIGAWGNFGADQDSILSIGKLAKDNLHVYVPIDRYVSARWLENCQAGGSRSYLSLFDKEGIERQHENFRDAGEHEGIPKDLVFLYPISGAAQEITERVWRWKEQNIGPRHLLAPWLSPDTEKEIEETVQRSVVDA